MRRVFPDSEPIAAIVPLKTIKKSKTRLSPLLDSRDRAVLTVTMLSNVLMALRKSKVISEVTVISADRHVRQIAHKYGGAFLWEGQARGLNRAVKLATRRLAERNIKTALIIHADLPLLTSRDISKLVSKSRGFHVVIVPSRDGAGTNALVLSPLNAIPPVFGKGSFGKHQLLANQRKLRSRALRVRGIAFDIDEPQDLHQLMRCGVRNETFRLLKMIHARKSNRVAFDRVLL